MLNWQPIEDAPKPSEWLRQKAGSQWLVACVHVPMDEDGNQDGDPYILWAHVVGLSHDGWTCGTYGFAGTHGYACFIVKGATHFMPLPALQSSGCTALPISSHQDGGAS